jgi:hypothetical protein
MVLFHAFNINLKSGFLRNLQETNKLIIQIIFALAVASRISRLALG